MTEGKKKRMSLLDNLTTAQQPPAPPQSAPVDPSAAPAPAPAAGQPSGMMPSNRALRSARDAVDAHRVWDLDPEAIDDYRPLDRLDLTDIAELRSSIEANGQTVPILVRRQPNQPDRYLLVYGARRLAAIRDSEKVEKVRALIANMDDEAALVAQVAENTGRRDLSFIERALFAQHLLDSGFGTQAQVAEVLNATKSSVSMALSILRTITPDLAQTIGPAHGIGRPRWEKLADDMANATIDRGELIRLAARVRQKTLFSHGDPEAGPLPDPSVTAFEAVAQHLRRRAAPAAAPAAARSARTPLYLRDRQAGHVQRKPRGLRLDLNAVEPGFAEWMQDQAQDLIDELHARWQEQAEDEDEQQ